MVPSRIRVSQKGPPLVEGNPVRNELLLGLPSQECDSVFSELTFVPLRTRDVADPYFRDLIERENPGFDLDRCRPGDLVPLSGGEMFVALTEEFNEANARGARTAPTAEVPGSVD